MSGIDASSVKKLREVTNAGMMDCKRALVETAGNFEEAKDWLRKKGLSAAAKKSGKIASEGLVGLIIDDKFKSGSLIELNSETDFVARNDKFQDLAKTISLMSLSNNGDIEAIRSSIYPGTNHNVTDEITDRVAVIGENINLRRSGYLSVKEGVISGYIHNSVIPNFGKIAVLVALESNSSDIEALKEVGRKIAMHIAAERPEYLDAASVDPRAIEKEKEILFAQAKAAGKSDDIIAKMVESKIRTYSKEICLLEQNFVMDNKKTITQFIEGSSKEIGANISIKSFLRFELGEGIEKESVDFASEVASMAQK